MEGNTICFLGRRLGNYLGGKQPEQIDEIEDLVGTNLAKVHWPQNGRIESNEHIFIDCNRVAIVGIGQTSALIQIPDSNRHFIEIFSAGPFNGDEPEDVLRKYLDNPGGSRVCLSWGLPTEDVNDIAGFRIRGGLAAPLDLLDEVANDVDFFLTQPLAPGTYTFRVNPIDAFGNEKTSLLSVMVTVPGPVEPPDAPILFSLLGTTGTISWSPSPTAGITEYNVYSNFGDGGFLDFDTPFATVGGAATSASGTVGAGDWDFLVRAKKGTVEEENFDRRVKVIMDDDPPPLRIITGRPNPPSFLAANPLEGGKLQIIVGYDALNEDVAGRNINVYIHDEGSPEPSTPTEVLEIPVHETGSNIQFTLTIDDFGPLSDDTYTITARAEDADELENPDGLTITQVTDSVPPVGDITDLEGNVI